MRQILSSVSIVIVIFALTACSGASESKSETTTSRTSPNPPPPAAGVPYKETSGSNTETSGSDSGTTVTVLNGDPGGPTGAYKFTPSEQTFAVGETVTFVLKAESELHNFSIDELEVDLDVDKGSEERITVTFDEPGSYKFYCLFHEANGMTGTITVQ